MQDQDWLAKLRKEHASLKQEDWCMSDQDVDMTLKEIDRLTALIEVKDALIHVSGADNSRLREALKQIVSHVEGNAKDYPLRVYEAARAALTESK